jgi:hypothetical protein
MDNGHCLGASRHGHATRELDGDARQSDGENLHIVAKKFIIFAYVIKRSGSMC